MKKMIFGIVLTAALAANAQTSQKKKTAKKAKTTTISTSKSGVLAATTSTAPQAATASATPAASTTSAVQTSTVTTETVAPAVVKKWGASLLIDVTAAANEKDYAAPKKNQDKDTYETRIQNLSIGTTNYLGLSYKINPTQSVAVHQFFGYTKLANNNNVDEQKGVQQGPTRLVYSLSDFKIAGSDSFAIPLRAVIPDNTSMEKEDFRYGINSPIEISWTLNPKWTVSVLAYTALRVYGQSKIGQGNGATKVTHLGLEIGPNIYYNVSEKIQPYASVHTNSYFAEMNRLTKISETESLELEAGVNLTLPANIALTPAVAQSRVATTSDITLLKADETSYRLTGAVSF